MKKRLYTFIKIVNGKAYRKGAPIEGDVRLSKHWVLKAPSDGWTGLEAEYTLLIDGGKYKEIKRWTYDGVSGFTEEYGICENPKGAETWKICQKNAPKLSEMTGILCINDQETPQKSWVSFTQKKKKKAQR